MHLGLFGVVTAMMSTSMGSQRVGGRYGFVKSRKNTFRNTMAVANVKTFDRTIQVASLPEWISHFVHQKFNSNSQLERIDSKIKYNAMGDGLVVYEVDSSYKSNELASKIAVWEDMNSKLNGNFINYIGKVPNDGSTLMYFGKPNHVYIKGHVQNLKLIQLMLYSYLLNLQELHLNGFCHGSIHVNDFIGCVKNDYSGTLSTDISRYSFPMLYPFTIIKYSKQGKNKDLYDLGNHIWYLLTQKYKSDEADYITMGYVEKHQELKVKRLQGLIQDEKVLFPVTCLSILIIDMMNGNKDINTLLQYEFFNLDLQF